MAMDGGCSSLQGAGFACAGQGTGTIMVDRSVMGVTGLLSTLPRRITRCTARTTPVVGDNAAATRITLCGTKLTQALRGSRYQPVTTPDLGSRSSPTTRHPILGFVGTKGLQAQADCRALRDLAQGLRCRLAIAPDPEPDLHQTRSSCRTICRDTQAGCTVPGGGAACTSLG